MSVRTAREVLGDHLRMRREGDLERDLAENYHPEVIVLTAREAFRGRDGVRKSAHRLWRAVAEGGNYIYDSVLVEDRLGLLEWRARTDELLISTGVDAYMIEAGRIVGQTIHYRVENLELSVSASALSALGARGPKSVDDRVRAPEFLFPQAPDFVDGGS